MVGKRTIRCDSGAKESAYIQRDVEEGRPQQDRKYRFRDHGNLDLDDQRRVEFKVQLLKVIEESDLKE